MSGQSKAPGRGLAHQAVAAAVRELIATAPGSLQEIGQRMRPPRGRQRLWEWQTEKRLPQLGDLEALLEACTPVGLPEHERRQRFERLRRLHAAAKAEAASIPAAASNAAAAAAGSRTSAGA